MSCGVQASARFQVMTTDGWSWEIARPLVTPRPRPRDSWNSNSGYVSIFLQRLELYF